MDPMHKRIAVTAAGMMVIILVMVVVTQRSQNGNPTKSQSPVQNQSVTGQEVIPPMNAKDVREFRVTWNGGTYIFSHRCVTGDVTGNGKTPSLNYCVGDNQLVLVDPQNKETVIDDTNIVNPSGAPILTDVSVDASGIATVAYVIDSCTLFGDCNGTSATPQLRVDLKTEKLIP